MLIVIVKTVTALLIGLVWALVVYTGMVWKRKRAVERADRNRRG